MTFRTLAPLALLLVAGGCAKTGEIDVSGGGAGITAVRSACPVVGLPAGTGDVTLFDPATSRDASAIDVVASISNVRSTCDDQGNDVVTRITFDVRARRTRADAPREVVLPYFVAVTRGGSQVTAKRVSQVALRFDAGRNPAPAAANVRYGEHERNVLDFWKAETDQPAPLLFFIHGNEVNVRAQKFVVIHFSQER